MTKNTPLSQYRNTTGLAAQVASLLNCKDSDGPKYSAHDFSTFDHLHSRGRAATRELSDFLTVHPGSNLLDVGCGIGGPARFIAERFVCNVHGIDLTKDFCDTADLLNCLSGLDSRIKITQGDALSLPYPDNSFDTVWTQHTSMNILNKEQFYSEIHRVLKPGGMFLFHDIFSNDTNHTTEEHKILLPVPWASKPEHNHLVPGEITRDLLGDLGFHREIWNNVTAETHLWFHNYNINKVQKNNSRENNIPKNLPAGLGPKLFMGDDFQFRVQNLKQNLADNKLAVIQGVFRRS